MTSDKRQSPRYEKHLQVSFGFPYGFPYDATTKLKYEVEEKAQEGKFEGVSKNVCATGLCLTSSRRLEKGQHLHLEVYLPQGQQPIHMDGEVRWCDRSSLSDAVPTLFDAGIQIQTVEGQSVDETVRLDDVHHVLWSNVLEAVFGTFRKLVQDEKTRTA